MSEVNNTIILWGADNYHTLGVLRQLGGHNLDIVFLLTGKKEKCATYSKFCSRVVVTNSYEEGLSYLMDHYTDSENKAVILCLGDTSAEYVDKNRKKLVNFFYLSGTIEQGRLSEVDDKNVMTKIAERHGFTVPKSSEFSQASDTKDVTFPCILKTTQLNSGRLEFKTHICQDEKSLKKFKSYLHPDNKYILQQYIPKEKDLLVYGCRLNDGKVVLAGTYYKDRWSDDGGGSHGYVVPTVPDYCNPKGIESFLEEIEYHGLFSVEYGLYENKAYFYEFNLRNDGTSHVFFQGGANLPLAWVYDCLGIKNDVATKVSHKTWAMNEILDQINISRGVVTEELWKKEFEQATAYYYYYEGDLKPWKHAKRWAWLERIFRALLLRYRPYIVCLLNKI